VLTCEECGNRWTPSPRGAKPLGLPARWCSKQCRNKARYLEDKTRFPHRHQRNNSRIRATLICQWCDTTYTIKHGRSDTSRYCPRCRTLPGIHSPRRSSPLPWKQCPHCNRWHLHPRQKYCSNECRRLRNIDKVMGFYRQALAIADVKTAMHWRYRLVRYLADRDGRCCAECNRLINLKLSSGPRGNPMGPSIDHVIPRSHGGTDDLANLRLTHWKCNQARGNRGGGEQLRLVG
jgi:5-methylcytosine-specific restriction endonuclease McrA